MINQDNIYNKPIWMLAKINNQKPKVVRIRKVTSQELRLRPYKSVITS